MLAIACQVGLPAGTAAFRPATASRSPSHGTGTEWNSAVGHGVSRQGRAGSPCRAGAWPRTGRRPGCQPLEGIEELIARIWRGAVRADDAAAYASYIQQAGIEGYQKTPGNRGAEVLRRAEGIEPNSLP